MTELVLSTAIEQYIGDSCPDLVAGVLDQEAELATLREQVKLLREACEAICEFWDFATEEDMTTALSPDALIGGHDGDEAITIHDVLRAAIAATEPKETRHDHH